MKKAMIQTSKLCKSFHTGSQDQQVLKNLDIDIYEKDFTVIMGASGAGKSTLLYALSGMDRPTSGQMLCAGAAVLGCKNRKKEEDE